MKAIAPYAFFNGRIVPWDDAKVHVFSPVVKSGVGVFEGIRGFWNEAHGQMYLFRMREHMERLAFSQKVMRFERFVSTEYISRNIMELVRACGFRECIHIRPTIYVEGFSGPPAYGPIGVAITAVPMPISDRVTSGISAQVSSWMRIPDRAMPMRVKCHANYNSGRLATMQAEADGYQSAIFLNDAGKVSEGTGMCIFLIRNGSAVTPQTSSDILESVTRDTVIEILATNMDIATEERLVDRSELYNADEIFFCGTAWDITPVTSVDRLPVGDGRVGAVTRRLTDLYIDIASNRISEHPEWRTPAYKESPISAT